MAQSANQSDMVVLLVAISTLYFVLSSAQPSPECISAYNVVFENPNMTSCAEAYSALVNVTATEDQAMMVCNTSQECNGMIENVISLCGDTVGFG